MKLSGVTISSNSTLTERRVLPVRGEVLAQRGQTVEALTVVARADVPHGYHVIDVARQLGQPDVDMAEVMQKEEGTEVEANEVIALLKGRLAFLQRTVRAPLAGHIAKIGPGWVLLETERSVTELKAFVNGVVTGIVPHRGVVIEAHGAVIQAACGFGGEVYGRLNRLVDSPFNYPEAEALNSSLADEIIVAGRSLDEEFLRRAEEVGVRGLIVGSLDADLLELEPRPPVCVVATEGFGDVPMSPYTFGHLTALNGRSVSMRGQTPSLATPGQEAEAAPPLILSTSTRGGGAEQGTPAPATEVGSRVRVVRGRYLGVIGDIDSIPDEPQTTDIGLRVPGAYVTLDGGAHFIPWANLVQVN